MAMGQCSRHDQTSHLQRNKVNRTWKNTGLNIKKMEVEKKNIFISALSHELDFLQMNYFSNSFSFDLII